MDFSLQNLKEQSNCVAEEKSFLIHPGELVAPWMSSYGTFNLLLFFKHTMVTIICLHIFVIHIFSPSPTANSVTAEMLSCPFICNFMIWVTGCIIQTLSQDNCYDCRLLSGHSKSLFWNFPQLNKATLPKHSSNDWPMRAYKGLASLPACRITLKFLLTPNLCFHPSP